MHDIAQVGRNIEMLAWPFYTMEFRRIVKKLRKEEGYVSGIVFSTLDSYVRTYLILLIVMYCCLLYIQCEWRDYVVMTVFFVLMAKLDVNSAINRLIIPYTFGMKTQGTITHIRYGAIQLESPRGWIINYEFTDKNGKKRNGRLKSIKKEDMYQVIPKVGDEVDVYVNPNNPRYHAVYVPGIYKKLNLRVSGD